MTLKTIFAILREARSIAKEKRLAKTDSDERAAIARAFNDRYTYRFKDKAADKHAWMCPECNRTHITDGWDIFTGVQFPPVARLLRATAFTKTSGHNSHDSQDNARAD